MLSYPLRSQGRTDVVLLVSSPDEDTGGGLFAFDGREVEHVDRLSTGGLCLAGERLMRSLWSALADAPGEVLTYDDRGVQAYQRLDPLTAPHDIAWDGRQVVAVSTGSNSLLWVSPAGEITRTWRAPGQGDAWHLNCLCFHDGRLLASAFGRYPRHRDWSGRLAEPAGILFDVETGRDMLAGLHCPHHPRFVDDAWLVCNSAGREVAHVEPDTGVVRRRLGLQGWTRGVAVSDDYLFVGESAHRHAARWSTASVAVVCRRTWDLLGRLPLPCREVYDLLLVPAALLEGVRRGFRTNAQRAAEQEQYALFAQAGVQPLRLWASGDPLPPEACRVHVAAELPAVLEADADVELSCTVENTGRALLVSAPPNPVLLSYRWFAARTGRWLPEPEALRTRLPHTLVPGRPAACRMKVRAPAAPGKYRLRITLVQEHVAWFDEADPQNACERRVEVVARRPLWKRVVRWPVGQPAGFEPSGACSAAE
jgi:acetolactate synthase-1/2/3 large subunit